MNIGLTDRAEFAAFKAGFEAGKEEQMNEDYPDVGLYFPKSVESHWNNYKKLKKEIKNYFKPS